MVPNLLQNANFQMVEFMSRKVKMFSCRLVCMEISNVTNTHCLYQLKFGMTTQMIWNSTKWALEYLLSKKNFKNKKLPKKINIFDSIFFNIKKKKRKQNLNANSMNLSYPYFILHKPLVHPTQTLSSSYTNPQFILYTPLIYPIHTLNLSYTNPQFILHKPFVYPTQPLSLSYTHPQFILYTPVSLGNLCLANIIW